MRAVDAGTRSPPATGPAADRCAAAAHRDRPPGRPGQVRRRPVRPAHDGPGRHRRGRPARPTTSTRTGETHPEFGYSWTNHGRALRSLNIVLPDIDDLDAVIDNVTFAATFWNGQSCLAGTRLFVHDDLCLESTEKLVKAFESIRIGSPLDPATRLGGLVSATQGERVPGYVETGKAEATLLTGGSRVRVAGAEHGWFVAPTIFETENHTRIAREEIFGPVLKRGREPHARHKRPRSRAIGTSQSGFAARRVAKMPAVRQTRPKNLTTQVPHPAAAASRGKAFRGGRPF
ncbi:aldehyde dehydrogenase family protein [Amycolatopsis sp. NPDC051372]|uniref:aldehyde dehydrogenase family protein n=1 Tax=Amycolatopsis sp. NPDC051372 TaxID=3155669 RepID=UPI003448828C